MPIAASLYRQVPLGGGPAQSAHLAELLAADRAQVNPLGGAGDAHEQDALALIRFRPLVGLLGEPRQEHAVEGQALGLVERRDLGDEVCEIARRRDPPAPFLGHGPFDLDSPLGQAFGQTVEEAVRGHDNADALVEDLALADDLGEPVHLFVVGAGHEAERALPDPLLGADLGQVLGAFERVLDELGRQVGHIDGIPVGPEERDLRQGDPEFVLDEGLVGAVVEDLLLGVDEDRHVPGDNLEDVVDHRGQVLPLVDEHELERVLEVLGRPDKVEDFAPDAREIGGFAPGGPRQARADVLLVDGAAPVVKGAHRLVGQAQEFEPRADILFDDVGEDEDAVARGRDAAGPGDMAGAVDEDLRFPRAGKAHDQAIGRGRELDDPQLVGRQVLARDEPGDHRPRLPPGFRRDFEGGFSGSGLGVGFGPSPQAAGRRMSSRAGVDLARRWRFFCSSSARLRTASLPAIWAAVRSQPRSQSSMAAGGAKARTAWAATARDSSVRPSDSSDRVLRPR